MRSFEIEVRGHRYRGLWRVESDDRIEVRSDYGTVWASLHGRAPAEAAREILTDLAPLPAGSSLRQRTG